MFSCHTILCWDWNRIWINEVGGRSVEFLNEILASEDFNLDLRQKTPKNRTYFGLGFLSFSSLAKITTFWTGQSAIAQQKCRVGCSKAWMISALCFNLTHVEHQKLSLLSLPPTATSNTPSRSLKVKSALNPKNVAHTKFILSSGFSINPENSYVESILLC